MEDCADLINRPLHVVMFPWLAQGHISPFLDLSKKLADRGLRISFLSTPRNISKIKSSLGVKWIGAIDFLELPLPSVEGLPSGADNTADIPLEMADVLKKALDCLEKPFEKLLQRIQPDCVIHDFSQYWAATVAAKFGIPAVYFSIYSATAFSYVAVPSRNKAEETTAEDLTTPPPGYPSSVIAFKPFEASSISFAYNSQNGDVPVVHRLFKCTESCRFIIIRSCAELEGKYIDYLEAAMEKAVVPVGLLLPEAETEAERCECLAWLDAQAPSSVVYVSFGSECFLSREQIAELANGLEASQVPFLWVLRFPRYSDCNSADDQEARARAFLPEGFEDRTRERGLVYCQWAPQQHILRHLSVGGFLSHCGWSSVLEALRFGVRIIGLPMHIIQGLDARLVANELQIGVEVGREEDGSFQAGEICRSVKEVMVGSEGRRVGENIVKMGDKMMLGEERYILEELVTRLLELREFFSQLCFHLAFKKERDSMLDLKVYF